VSATLETFLRDLVDARVGVVRSCSRAPRHRTQPPRPVIYEATLSNFDYRRPGPGERSTSGKGMTETEAATAAIVEALERYCASQRPPGSLVRAAPASLAAPALSPGEFVLYSKRQYAEPGMLYRQPDDELTWVLGALAGSNRPVYVPAALVFLDLADPTELFAQPTSNGLAGGRGLDAAVLSGLYELVERDAFLVTWLARLSPARIELGTQAGIVDEVRRHYRRFDVELVAFDATNDVGIPVVIALAVDRSGALPAASVGLGCNLDAEIALRRAVMEVVQVRTASVPLHRLEPRARRVDRYEDVRTLEDHATFAANPDNLHELDFLFDGGAVRPLDEREPPPADTADALAVCCDRLGAAGSTPVYVDLTLPDLEPYGLRIVRTLATGLQPMHFGTGQERLGGRRPFEVPRRLGRAMRDLEEAELNPCPHPLA
jgi:ribosomal protein S12 methylthiotransferase accessory factor